MRTKKLGRPVRKDMVKEVQKALKQNPTLTPGQLQKYLMGKIGKRHDRKSIWRWMKSVA